MPSVQPAPFHLLLAEDEDTIRELVKDRVSLELDYRVTAVKNGREALERFIDDPPDVVVSDIRMPEMSGLDLLKEVKRRDPSVPCIIMSGHGDIEDTVTALRGGAQDFFLKPFKMAGLLASIERAYQLAAARRMKGEVRNFLVSELREFEMPNDLELVPYLIADLTRNLEEGNGITYMEMEGIRAALHEILLNAIEHGNLEISYEEKSELMRSPEGWREEILRRAHLPRFRDRIVRLSCENLNDMIRFRVTDQGAGFDRSSLPDPTELTHVLHGRGILITKVHMDEVHYNEVGNEVTLIKYKKTSDENLAA